MLSLALDFQNSMYPSFGFFYVVAVRNKNYQVLWRICATLEIGISEDSNSCLNTHVRRGVCVTPWLHSRTIL